MIDLAQWRAAIGLWLSSSLSLCMLRGGACTTTATSTTTSTTSTTGGPVAKWMKCLLLAVIVAVVSSLLILSGDVETNPGPTSGKDVEIKEIIKILLNILDDNYLVMSEAVKGCYGKFVISMYAAELISGTGQLTFDKIMSEYKKQMKLITDISQLQKHCKLLLVCFVFQQNMCQHVGKMLSERWQEEIHKKFCFSLIDTKLTKTENFDEKSLMLACTEGNLQMVDFIFQQQIDFTDNTWIIQSFVAACLNGHLQVVKSILRQNIDPNAKDDNGWTPLASASFNGNLHVVKLLLKQQQVELNIQMKDGRTALMLACQNEHLQVVEILLKQQAYLNIQDENGLTALMVASKGGLLQVARLLLKQQADPNIRSKNGRTALMLASFNKHLQVAELLLKQQADPNIQAEDGLTALMFACQNVDFNMVQLLLKQRANPDIQMKNGGTALMLASQKGHLKVIETLLGYNADPNVQAEDGLTALMLASQNGHYDVVELLINRKADPRIKRKDGKTASMLASDNKHQKIVNFLNIIEIPLDKKAREFGMSYDESSSNVQNQDCSKQNELQSTKKMLHDKQQQYDHHLEDLENDLKITNNMLKEYIEVNSQLKTKLEQTEEEKSLYKDELNSMQKSHQQTLQNIQLFLDNTEKELRMTQQLLEDKETELRMTQQLLEEKETELKVAYDSVQPQTQQHQNWLISSSEIVMKEQVLGEGAYGSVKVAMFRGSKVAAKCLHNLVVSEYTLALFSREMDIASSLRHPNIVQFIGATIDYGAVQDRRPVILMELMTTSLYKELHVKHLTQAQIIQISRDVALALNYLHQWKPNPIIHRDISSPNILLDPSIGDTYKAKITDYGTANLQPNIKTPLPGNPAYSSPESNNPEIHSPQMDVYSYSIVLMEMILHRPPDLTIRKREHQAKTIKWLAMKSLILKGISSNYASRPNMIEILDILQHPTIHQ